VKLALFTLSGSVWALGIACAAAGHPSAAVLFVSIGAIYMGRIGAEL
jgi:hypothetical protein